jgi:hypothetical protein
MKVFGVWWQHMLQQLPATKNCQTHSCCTLTGLIVSTYCTTDDKQKDIAAEQGWWLTYDKSWVMDDEPQAVHDAPLSTCLSTLTTTWTCFGLWWSHHWQQPLATNMAIVPHWSAWCTSFFRHISFHWKKRVTTMLGWVHQRNYCYLCCCLTHKHRSMQQMPFVYISQLNVAVPCFASSTSMCLAGNVFRKVVQPTTQTVTTHVSIAIWYTADVNTHVL